MVLSTQHTSSDESFCELASDKALQNLRKNLPSLQLHTPFSTKSVKRLDDAQLLQAYFEFYGFDLLSDVKSAHNYYFGRIDHNDLALASHVWYLPSSTEFVLVVHGLFDHVGLYLKLVDYLLKSGFSVVAVDMPGHGLSTGAEGVIGDFADYAQSIHCALEGISSLLIEADDIHDVSKVNWSAVGQSTGSAALMRFLFSERESSPGPKKENVPVSSRLLSRSISHSFFRKAVLIAPLVRPKSWWRVYPSFFLISRFVPSVKRKFSENSHDKDFIVFLREKDPLQSRHISVEWVGAMIQWVKSFSLFPSCSIPVLIVQGTADKTVDFVKNIPLIKNQFSNTEVLQVENARHHFVNETDKYRLPGFEKIVSFLKDI